MKKAALQLLTLSFPFLVFSQANVSAAEKHHAVHWSYTGHGNPAQWAQLNPDYETCANGVTQSPINITKAEKADLPGLEFQYQESAPSIVNNGHTIQINLASGNFLTVGSQKLELLQFHFHTPSEEQINGKRSEMVAHFVHKSAEGQLGVVALLIKSGSRNKAFTSIFQHLPRKGETITVENLKLDLNAMLPNNKNYYTFTGSLTTPPCTENVQWIVLKQAISLSPKQIKAFKNQYAFNARPVQAIHDRKILVSDKD
jgi:carbonic anhydrase